MGKVVRARYAETIVLLAPDVETARIYGELRLVMLR
jgi:hypothetical protein